MATIARPSPRVLTLLAATLGLAAWGGALAQTAPQPIGVASAVAGDVKLSNVQIARPRPVAIRQRIALADLIQTGKASQMQILLLDRSTFSIGANAALRIDRFVYDPVQGRSAAASVARGAFRFMSGRQSTRNTATIGTNVATIGIRGTMIDGAVGDIAREIARNEAKEVRDARADPQTATLVVLRGPGARTQGGEAVGAASVTAGGATIELTEPMQAGYVPRAGALPIAFRLSPAGLARLQDRIAPRLAPSGGSAAAIIAGILGAAAATGVLGGSGGEDGGTPDKGPQGSGTSTQNPGRGQSSLPDRP